MACILIADDDKLVRQFMRDVLGSISDAEVDEAKSVREAVEKTVSRAFDLVLADQNFPDGTLADFCKLAAERRPDTAAVPKLMITGARPASWDAAFWKNFGVTGYLVKPCKIDEIKEAVGKILPLKR